MAPIYISVVSVLLSVLSICFAMYSWSQSYRPIVTVRVATHTGGNTGTALNLIIENTGNRPAKDIRLSVNENDLQRALSPKHGKGLLLDVRRCLSNKVVIQVLSDGRAVSNAFGHLSNDDTSTWITGSLLPIRVHYAGMGRRKYCSKMNLLLYGDEGFAQFFWEKSS